MRGKCKAEDTVCPLEIDTSHVKVTGERIHIKEVVLDAVALASLQIIDDDRVASQVRDVGVRVLALARGHIHHDVGEEGVILHIFLVEDVLMGKL